MRIAIVSDIHGNRTAFEAVLADLRYNSPDLILHGGDLADTGSGPVEIVDQIRSLGWQGVAGNTDQMLAMPETFEVFAGQSPNLESLWTALREMAVAAREALGEERLTWLRSLPLTQFHAPVALVHASPENPWRAPEAEAGDNELQYVYGPPLNQQVAVYGHIHRPFVRELAQITVANTGSVGLPHDRDCRASYLLIDHDRPKIRRVEYDVDQECRALSASGLPHADWVARILKSASPQMP
jgi:predicted phosphodiesterase